jgi:hypothetical protein
VFKDRMKYLKKYAKAILTAALCLPVVLGAAACGGPDKGGPASYEASCEYGAEFDLYSLEGRTTEAYYELVVTSPSGKSVLPLSRYFLPDETGIYDIKSPLGPQWKVSVVKTRGPVVILRGDVGSYYIGDTVRLPAVTVRDYTEGDIEKYTAVVTRGGVNIPLDADRSFTAAETGEYLFTVTAANSAGLQTKTEKAFNVYPNMDKTVAPGTSVTLSEAGDFITPLDAGKTWTVTFTVHRDGSSAPIALSGGKTFTVAAGSYYEVRGTAEETGNPSNKAYSYALYRAEGLQLASMNKENSALRYGVRSDRSSYKFVRDGQNTALEFRQNDPVAGFSTMVVIPVKTDKMRAADGSRVRVKWDVWVTGFEGYDFKNDPNKFLLIAPGLRLENTTYKGKAEYEGTVVGGEVAVSMTLRDPSKPFYFDNFTFENIGGLSVKTDRELARVDKGAAAPRPDASLFGLEIYDFTGEALTPALTAVRRSVSYGAFTPVDPLPETLATNADCAYEMDFTAVSPDGVSRTVTLKLSVGDYDIEPPVIEFLPGRSTDQTLAANSSVALAAAAFGLKVTDASGYALSFTVKKDGAPAAASAFTVAAGSYYEILVTAADPHGNAASRYVLIKASDCYLVTFDDYALQAAPAGEWVCNEYGVSGGGPSNGSRSVVDLGNGNRAFTFTPGSDRILLNFPIPISLPAGMYRVELNLRLESPSANPLFIASDASYAVPTGGILSEVTGGKLLSDPVRLSGGDRYQLFLYCGDPGAPLYIEGIRFIPA